MRGRDLSPVPTGEEQSAAPLRWAIVTGEYPPQPGGVSDYTRLVARALAAAGDEVHVWAPAHPGSPPDDAGVSVHPMSGRFSPADMRALSRALDALPPPYRLLVQYVPQSFGWKGMNLAFCAWMLSRRQPVWVMFHEIVFPLERGQPFTHRLYALVTRVMAATAVRAADRVLVSTPGWADLIPRIARAGRRAEWLPIPSNFDPTVDAAVVRAVRARLAPRPDTVVLGHFGTYGGRLRDHLRVLLPALLQADHRRVVLLLGRGSEPFGRELREKHPLLAERVLWAGEVPAGAVVPHLAACDLLVQPCEGGVTSRRSTIMAGLAIGAPIVTNDGQYTEPVWRDSGAVALAPAETPEALRAAAESVLADASLRAALGLRAAALYRDRFALPRTVSALRNRAEV